jgi:hypothetical protein
VLPKVESPIPETIGLGAAFGLATNAGAFFFVLATVLGRSNNQRVKWAAYGTVLGMCAGWIIYLTALAAELL